MSWLSASRVFDLLIEGAIKSTVVLTVALVLAAFLRKRSATLRHFVLACSLAGLLLIPILLFLSPGWKTPLLPSWLEQKPLTQDRPPVRLFANSQGPMLAEGRIQPFAGEASVRIPAKTSPPETHASKDAPAVSFLGNALLALWSAGLFLILMRMGIGLQEASRLTREGRLLDDPVWRVLLTRFLSFLRLKRKIVLKSHHRVAVPLTWGWRKPVILMPEESRLWEESRRSTSLLHELSHIKRSDFAVMLVVRLSLALFWFNPLTWFVLGRMKKEQEKACDEWVLRSGAKPSTYASHLLSFQKRREGALGSTVALLGLSNRPSFNDRLFAILKQKIAFQEVKMKSKMMLSLAVALAVALVGTARPSSSPGEAFDTALQSVEAAPAADSAQAAAGQEKKEAEKEKKPAKKPLKKSILISNGDVQKGTIEIVMTRGEKVNRMTLDTPVTIKQSGEPERTLVVLSKDKEVLTVKGDDYHLEIKAPKTAHGSKTIVLEGGKAFRLETGEDKLVKARTFHITTEPHIKIIKEGEVQVITEPHVKIIKEGEVKSLNLAKALDLSLREKLEIKEGSYRNIREIIRESLRAAQEVPLRNVLEKYKTRMEADLFQHLESDLKSSVEAQQNILRNLEETLEKLSEVLEFKSKAPGVITLARKEGIIEIDRDKDVSIVTIDREADKGDHAVQAIAVKTLLKKADRQALDRAVEKMKAELPQGLSLDVKFDEDSGTAVVTIRGPEDAKQDLKSVIKKIMKMLEEEGLQ